MTEPTDWILDGQCFSAHEYGVRYLSINDVKSYLKKNPRRATLESVRDIAKAAGGFKAIEETCAGGPARPVDMRVPVVLYRLSEGTLLLVDGYHRLYKALRTREDQLLAVLVEESEVPCYRGSGP